MNDFEDGKGFYSIDLKNVMNSDDFLPVTRLLAVDLMKNPYLIVGDFFKKMPDETLQTLLELSEDIDEGNTGEDFILLSQMLATGEGLEFSNDVDEVMARVNIFVNYLAIESLARKKMVKIYRENMSFGEDMGDKIVVEKLPDIED